MDFADSYDSANAKCNRVRSWYLYEQYRSLEENQLDAAQRLKNKSYQDKILRQELSERRARRRLCDQFGLCQSESRLGRSVQNVPSNVILSDDDLFESFCEIHDEYELENYEDNNSQGSETDKQFEDFKSTDTRKVYSASVKSVTENVKIDKLDADIKEELKTVKNNIAENITLQLETVKENIECLEKYAKLNDDEELPDVDNATLNSTFKLDVNDFNSKLKKDSENSVIGMWSKLVNFAYRIINLNRGNCYYDYSSQLLTAVLACDILLRGVNQMCNILQPYVSPIKYATSDSETSLISNKNTKRKKSVNYKKFHKTNHSAKNHKFQNFDKKYHSENDCHNCCKSCYENYLNERKYCGASEPLRYTSKLANERKYSEKSNSKWSDLVRDTFSKGNVCKCSCLNSAINPIIQLALYIENLLQDIEELN